MTKPDENKPLIGYKTEQEAKDAAERMGIHKLITPPGLMGPIQHPGIIGWAYKYGQCFIVPGAGGAIKTLNEQATVTNQEIRDSNMEEVLDYSYNEDGLINLKRLTTLCTFKMAQYLEKLSSEQLPLLNKTIGDMNYILTCLTERK